MKNQLLEANKTTAEIVSCLKQFNSNILMWKEKKGKYYVYKTTKNKYLRTALSFYFICEVYDTGTKSKTFVKYRVVPAISSIALMIVLPLPLINTVYNLFVNHSRDMLFLALCIAVNAAFVLNYLITRHRYINEFEERILGKR